MSMILLASFFSLPSISLAGYLFPSSVSRSYLAFLISLILGSRPLARSLCISLVFSSSLCFYNSDHLPSPKNEPEHIHTCTLGHMKSRKGPCFFSIYPSHPHVNLREK
ncbi:MAG: hypothetical protein JOS17DRAFT_764849 [Linnemannia elongata]|nr:MAG: hypothetical protein JOS17DRAFT_764849 [Linnemannia elongata]